MARTRRAKATLQEQTISKIDPEAQKMVDIEVKKVLKVSAIARAEYEEIKACAYLGFLEAQRRFDPRKGVLFSSFARQRVRGAILDGIAHLSPLGRKSVRAINRSLKKQDIQAFETGIHEQRLLAQADEQHQANLSETFSGGEEKEQSGAQSKANSEIQESVIQKKTDDSVPQSFLDSYRSLYFQAIHFWVESLSSVLASDPAEPYENQLAQNSANERLSAAFETLSTEQQKLLIAIYDLRRVGDSAAKYAERMKLHRSTVSRRHAAAIEHLRTAVNV